MRPGRELSCTFLLIAVFLPLTWGTDGWMCAVQAQVDAPVDWQAEHMVAGSHDDYPWITLDGQGQTWVIYVAHGGEADRLRLARVSPEEETVEPISTVAGPGMIHRPRLVADGDGTLWAVYAKRTLLHRWALRAQRIEDGEPVGKSVEVSRFSKNHIFPDVTRASDGKIWIVWQALGEGGGSIFARNFDPTSQEWSRRIAVSSRRGESSSWRPRIAAGAGGSVRVLYERATRGEFDLHMAMIGDGGTVSYRSVAETPSYEAFGEIASGPGGQKMVLAWEEGRENWGTDTRSHHYNAGLNAGKRIKVARLNLRSGELEPLPPVEPLLVRMLGGIEKSWHLAVNQPQVAVDGTGAPWVFLRWEAQDQEVDDWQIAALRYSREEERWSEPVRLKPSSFFQDRLISAVRTEEGGLQMAWPADTLGWTSGKAIGVHVAGIDPEMNLAYPSELPRIPDLPDTIRTVASSKTPERPRSDRYRAKHEGTGYKLYWGDTHRHTDLSPDRTIWDGTLTEHYRYAYEVAELDFLGTSDHTDIGPSYYTSYKWWQSQKITDYLSAPGYFLGLYGYEREQGHPWGHRNVMFSEIGGPIVYIQRETYQQSESSEQYPVRGSGQEISPQEMWEVLREAGIPVAVISHTPADRGMGTDWRKYDQIDHHVENTVEIYQGARISYEAVGAPQPTVGIKTDTHPDSLTRGPNACVQRQL